MMLFLPKKIGLIQLLKLPEGPGFTPNDVKSFLVFLGYYYGNYGIGVILALLLLIIIRNFNKDKMFNKGIEYKDYPYCWYWVCAKFLGYTKCSLVLVPINMQFKLVINDTFSSFYTGDIKEKSENVSVQKEDVKNSKQVNLIIADTYPIVKRQLPHSKEQYPSIIVSRKDSEDRNRYKNCVLVEKINNLVNHLPDCTKEINIYATTNPANTMCIAKEVFGAGSRGNFELITVFQQSSDRERKFEEKGMVVYKR